MNAFSLSWRVLPWLALGVAFSQPAAGITIVLDYTYDTGGFFSGNAAAKASLDQAAADLGSVITSTLGAIAPSTLAYTGTNGSTTATADWSISFNNPTTGATVTLNNFSAATNEYRIFVGAQTLAVGQLGQGGPVGAGFSLTGGGVESQWQGAVTAMQTASNNALLRSSGPVIGTLNGSSTLGATSANYALSYGVLAGSLTFNSSVTAWQYDHTAPVGAGNNDFYSVALHEMIHTLGFGTSASWDADHSGTTWLGADGIAANGGTGVGLVDSGGSHIADGAYSKAFGTQTGQDAVMEPLLTTGTRRYLTDLDVAMLEDIGFSVSAIPEPSTYALLAGLAMAGLVVRRRLRRGREVAVRE